MRPKRFFSQPQPKEGNNEAFIDLIRYDKTILGCGNRNVPGMVAADPRIR
jgi:hypothetical protein